MTSGKDPSGNWDTTSTVRLVLLFFVKKIMIKFNQISLTTHNKGYEDKEALEFYKMIDYYISEINKYEATIVITADHGMKSKHKISGEPEVIFIQDYLDDWLGNSKAKIILPITDPYVVHHGALGSYATIYFENSYDINISREKLLKLSEIEEVYTKQEAVEKFKLPSDRIGDLVIISIEKMTIGKTKTYHNLKALKEPLRSHGGLSEQLVPFIINKPYELPSAPYLNNFDAFYTAVIYTSITKQHKFLNRIYYLNYFKRQHH